MYDIGIIGGGPAALSAAVSARQRNKSVCIFGRSLDSSLLFAAEKVDNYLGLPDLSGEELLNQFYAESRAWSLWNRASSRLCPWESILLSMRIIISCRQKR